MRPTAIFPALALALAACHAPPERPSAPGPAFSRTAATLAGGACTELDDRLFSLASGADGVTDLFVLVKTCAAKAERDELALVVEAYAWLAVDRDLGPVSIKEFVHVTLRVEARLGTTIAYRGDRAEVTLTARSGTKVSVEPVGTLEVEASNWASLLALQLAPSAGASSEAIAKRKLRDGAEAAVRSALAQPIVIAYDGRTGATSFGGVGVAPVRGAAPMRVVPRGTSVSGRRPPSSAPASASVHVVAGERVAIRAVCCSLVERLLDADRRGEPVGLEDWTIAEHDASVALPPMPCSWTLAARAVGDAAAVLTIEVPPAPPSTVPPRADRWVALDLVSADLHEDEVGPLTLEISSVAWRHALTAKSPSLSGAIVELSPDDAVWVRTSGVAAGATRLPLDDVGDVDVSVPVPIDKTQRTVTLRVRGRVRAGRP